MKHTFILFLKEGRMWCDVEIRTNVSKKVAAGATPSDWAIKPLSDFEQSVANAWDVDFIPWKVNEIMKEMNQVK